MKSTGDINRDIEDLLGLVNSILDLKPEDKDKRLYDLSYCFVLLRDEIKTIDRPLSDKHYMALKDKLSEVTSDRQLLIKEMHYENQKSLQEGYKIIDERKGSNEKN